MLGLSIGSSCPGLNLLAARYGCAGCTLYRGARLKRGEGLKCSLCPCPPMCLGEGPPFSGWSTEKGGNPFQVCTKVQCELMSLHARGCSPLTEILMILSNMTSGETWKSKTKYWRGKDPEPLSLVGRS